MYENGHLSVCNAKIAGMSYRVCVIDRSRDGLDAIVGLFDESDAAEAQRFCDTHGTHGGSMRTGKKGVNILNVDLRVVRR